MMLLALAGVLLLLKRKITSGIAVLTLSVLTKWVTGLLLVFAVLIESVQATPGRRWRTAAHLVLTATLVAAICYGPFATGLVGRGGIHELALHGGTSIGNSSRAWLPQWLVMVGFGLVVAGTTRFAVSSDWTRTIAVTALLVLLFNLVVVPWIFPWYLMTPAILAAVLPRDTKGFAARLLCFGLAAGLMLYYAKIVPIG
jgi:hypothetical protein